MTQYPDYFKMGYYEGTDQLCVVWREEAGLAGHDDYVEIKIVDSRTVQITATATGSHVSHSSDNGFPHRAFTTARNFGKPFGMTVVESELDNNSYILRAPAAEVRRAPRIVHRRSKAELAAAKSAMNAVRMPAPKPLQQPMRMAMPPAALVRVTIALPGQEQFFDVPLGVAFGTCVDWNTRNYGAR